MRPTVLEAAKTEISAPGKSGPFNLLVFGGSQGAQYFSEAIPAAIALIEEAYASGLLSLNRRAGRMRPW